MMTQGQTVKLTEKLGRTKKKLPLVVKQVQVTVPSCRGRRYLEPARKEMSKPITDGASIKFPIISLKIPYENHFLEKVSGSTGGVTWT
jgi:hypothetical protein